MAATTASLPAGNSTEIAKPQKIVSQWEMTWRKFRRHKLAMASAIVIIGLYVIAAAPEFFSYADPHESEADRALIAPQRVRFFHDGSFQLHVFALEGARDPNTFQKIYVANPDEVVPVKLFARGYEYELFGLFTTDIHLFGVEDGNARQSLAFMGTDLQGRDLFSRMLFATRISMTIGLVSVILSLAIGLVLGGISGYFGGWIDLLVQRIIEIVRSIPTIPLWMGLAAAMPQDWSIVRIYLTMTIIISLVGWTDLARVIRGRFLSLRHEDFVTAARVCGCGPQRIMFRHMMPTLVSHIIAVTTLAVPAMIISETTPSFHGLGLRPPAISWGVLLQAAQNVQAIAMTPWLMLPAVLVVVAVIAFNFLGDGLRDCADPFTK